MSKEAYPPKNDLLQNAWAHRRALAWLALLLVFAVGIGMLVDTVSREVANGQQARLQAQMQDAVQRHQEDLQRQSILFESSRKAALQNEYKQFVSILNYDEGQMNESGNEYGEKGNVSDANLAAKAAAAEKFALQVNEFFSHLDGFTAFVNRNEAGLQALGGEVNTTAMKEYFDLEKTYLRSIEAGVALELETFAQSNRYRAAERMAVVQDALDLLKEGQPR